MQHIGYHIELKKVWNGGTKSQGWGKVNMKLAAYT